MSKFDDEVELIEGLKNKSQASYKKLVETYWIELNFLVSRILNDPSGANDCVQEAFIKAINKIDDFEGKGSFKGWLRRIVVNEALMVLRRETARKEDSLDELMHEFDEFGRYIQSYQGQPVSLDILQESEETRKQVRHAIDKLPEKFRVTLVLRDIEGYTTREVAEMTNTSEENVKVRLHRARLALRKLLEPVLREESK